MQRKVLQPNDFEHLAAVEGSLNLFERHWSEVAEPFLWNFTRRDLESLIARLAELEPRLRLAA